MIEDPCRYCGLGLEECAELADTGPFCCSKCGSEYGAHDPVDITKGRFEPMETVTEKQTPPEA